MNSLRVFNRQAGFVIAIAALLLALVVPTLANAAQVTDRSIALGSSAKDATNVSYTVNFKAASDNTGAFLLDFCNNSPIIGETCTAPTGLDLTNVATSTSGYSLSNKTANSVIVTITTPINAGGSVTDLVLDGIDNPTVTGPMYARIVSYDNATDAGSYVANAQPGTGYKDQAGVALYITDTIGVSAAVKESMTFCVSGQTITANCASAGSHAPVLELGETSGTTKALSSTAISTGDIFTQISTNAASGAIVSLKSSADGCGGLINSSEPTGCYIKPALQTGLTAGQAKFGVIVNADTDPSDNGVVPDGHYSIRTGSGYDAAAYALNWASNNQTGVTSVFGDPILDTQGAPANNKNVKLTFGASVSNSTPAGKYAADLSLIATGQF